MQPQPHLAGGAANIVHVSVPSAGGATSGSSTGGGGNIQQNQRVIIQTPQQPHDLIVEQIRNNLQLKQLMLGCYQA